MTQAEEFYKLCYWTISSYAYDSSSHIQKKMKKYEDRGFLGYTCSNISKWESRKIRKWAKELDKEIYVSRDIEFSGDWLTYDDIKHYIFQERCITMHFPKKYLKSFTKLVESLPERKYIVDIVISDDHYDSDRNAILKRFKRHTRHQNSNAYSTCIQDPNEDHLLLQFSDKEAAIEFKLLMS